MIKFKSEIRLNQAIHDPLLNPNQGKSKKDKNKIPTNARKNLFDDNDDNDDNKNKKKFNPLAMNTASKP